MPKNESAKTIKTHKVLNGSKIFIYRNRQLSGSKKNHYPCGDAFCNFRDSDSTYIILADGIGSGINANIAANMCLARIRELIENGISFRMAFESVAATMQNWRSPDMPFAAFTAVRILNDGQTTIYNYDAPEAICISQNTAVVLPHKNFIKDEFLAKESSCFLMPGDAILIYSDGITQSGIGIKDKKQFQPNLIADYINFKTVSVKNEPPMSEQIFQKAIENSNGIIQDDITVVCGICRYGKELNILTGAPISIKDDKKTIDEFFASAGDKVICGATTAKIAAKHTGNKLKVDTENTSLITPPKYFLKGTKLVTEGTITLNHLNNILELEHVVFDEQNPVRELYELIINADRIKIWAGLKTNQANEHISFYQQGILSRVKIIPLIIQKLQSKGKAVIFKEI